MYQWRWAWRGRVSSLDRMLGNSFDVASRNDASECVSRCKVQLKNNFSVARFGVADLSISDEV